MKSYGMKSVNRAIDEIVKLREGEEAFNEMKKIDESVSINPNWNKRWWLEEKRKELDERIREICNINGDGEEVRGASNNVVSSNKHIDN